MQEFTSKNTSVNKNKTPKIYKEICKIEGWESNTINLDLGGGRYDIMTDVLLSEQNVTNLILDPFNRSKEHNEYVQNKINVQPADTITLSNVLCVIKEKEVRSSLLKEAYDFLKVDGQLYITAYEGDRSGIGKQTGQDQYQLNQPIAFYLDEIREIFPTVSKRGCLIIAKKEV